MKNINRDLRFKFDIRITSEDEVVASINGDTTIPSFMAGDFGGDAMEVFESIFKVIIHRPCSIGVCGFVENILKENHKKHTSRRTQEFLPVQLGEPLLPVAEVLDGPWPKAA